MAHLVRYLLAMDAPVPGVVGPASAAQAFSACWAEAVPSAAPRETMRMRVFEARTVADVPFAAGALRLASMDDHPIMAQWTAAFSQEALGESADLDGAKKSAARFIADGHLHIWDCNGPVSMAKSARPMRNGVTVNAVYTPPEQRNKGYATCMRRVVDQETALRALFVLQPICRFIQSNLQQHLCENRLRAFGGCARI